MKKNVVWNREWRNKIVLPVIINLLIIFLIVYIGIQSRKKTSPVNESTSQPAPDSEQVKQENTKREALARQKALEDKYFNSPLTREIIQTIRGGSNNLPEEIVVYDDRVTGRTNGVTRTYDFIANRVATLQRVYNCMLHYGDYELLLRPQVALGNAINRVLGGEYDVSDEAVRRREQHAHSDGEIYFLFHYTSDHVLLRLKPKTYF
jgi:hypothetical protein